MKETLIRCAANQFVRFGALIFLIIFLLCSGTTGSGDAMVRYAVAQSLVAERDVAIKVDSPVVVPGRDGRLYAFYGIGQSVLLAGPEAAVQAVCRLAGKTNCHTGTWSDISVGLSAQFLFPLLSTLGIIFLALCLQELGFDRQTALSCAALVFAGSMLLPYAKFHQEENQIITLTFAGLYYALRFYRAGQTRDGLLAALVCWLPMWFRVSALANSMVLGLFIVWAIWQRGDILRRKSVWLTLGGTGAVTLVWLLFYNWYRFGNVLEFGYSYLFVPRGDYNISRLEGLTGPFLNPSKSMLLFSPLIIVAAWGVRYAWRQKPLGPVLVCLSLLMFALSVIIPSGLRSWGADTAWGSRYQVAGHALFLIFAAYAWDNRATLKTWQRRALPVIASLAIAVQLAGAVFNYNLEYNLGLKHTLHVRPPQWVEVGHSQLPMRLHSLWRFRANWYTAPPSRFPDGVAEYSLPAFWPWKVGQIFGPTLWRVALVAWFVGWLLTAWLAWLTFRRPALRASSKGHRSDGLSNN